MKRETKQFLLLAVIGYATSVVTAISGALDKSPVFYVYLLVSFACLALALASIFAAIKLQVMDYYGLDLNKSATDYNEDDWTELND